MSLLLVAMPFAPSSVRMLCSFLKTLNLWDRFVPRTLKRAPVPRCLGREAVPHRQHSPEQAGAQTQSIDAVKNRSLDVLVRDTAGF